MALVAALAQQSACKDSKTKTGPKQEARTKTPSLSYPACGPSQRHSGLAPNVRPEMLTANFWIERLGSKAASQVLLNRAQIEAMNLGIESKELGVRQLPQALTEDAIKKQTTAFHQEQQAYVHAKLDNKSYVESKPGATTQADLRVKALQPRDDYFAFAKTTQLRCWPIEGGIFKPPIDKDFDRNNCTTLAPPSVVHRIVSTQEGNWHYVQGRFVEGWVQNPTWQPLSAKGLRKLARGPKRWVRSDKTLLKTKGDLSPTVAMGAVLPVDRKGKLAWPTQEGWSPLKLRKQPELSRTPLPLRRDTLLEIIFSQLDRPYGWGGRAAERDCSRLLMDVFRVFGLQLPRWSGHQAELENAVDISMLSIKDKRATLRRFGESNILLLFMPGHVMLYLGPDGERDYAISSISEFVTPCTTQDQTLGEQVHRLDRVTVTDLSLGKDSPRTSFIERITKMVRF